MKDSKEQFRNSIKNEFSKMMSGEQTGQIMQDLNKYTKEMKEAEKLKGGKADNMNLDKIAEKHNAQLIDIAKQFVKGHNVELEHTKDKLKASEIVMDHLFEDPKYYDKLSKVETKEIKKEEPNEATGSGSSGAFSAPLAFKDSDFVKKSFAETPGKLKEGIAFGAMGLSDGETGETTEATTSGSVGGYETPAMWAKSTKKKDWGPSRKTQYPGGAFVKVKKKCTKFPYCNQGDIKALKLSKNESVKEAIKKVSTKYNISEDVIKTILEYEYSKIKR